MKDATKMRNQRLFNSEYSQKEQEIKEIFKIRCQMAKLASFSADTFRMFGFDKFIVDPQHGIGSFFAKLVKNGDAVKVGWVPSEFASNHRRAIRLYEWVRR